MLLLPVVGFEPLTKDFHPIESLIQRLVRSVPLALVVLVVDISFVVNSLRLGTDRLMCVIQSSAASINGARNHPRSPDAVKMDYQNQLWAHGVFPSFERSNCFTNAMHAARRGSGRNLKPSSSGGKGGSANHVDIYESC